MEPASSSSDRATRVRYGVLGFACSLSMITYLDRVCFGTIAPTIQREFGLTDTQKGMLFSAFALAYAAFEVPSGWLGDVFGPRKTLIRIVLWWSIFTALTGLVYPVAGWSWFAFVAMLSVRFLFGMGEAGAYPNIARAFHNWFPFSERGSAQGAVWMAGRFAGGATPLVVTALLIESVSPSGEKLVQWRHTFWIFGILGVVWCAVFWWWFRDRPEQKTGVNQAELDLIRAGEVHGEASHSGVPWFKLLTNLNLWTLCMMYFFSAYGWYFNITWLPGYLKDHYHVTKETYGWAYTVMAGAPLLLGSASCLVGGLLTDRFIRRTGNRKWGRRLFGIVGHGICAGCFFAAVYASNPWLFVLALAFAAFWNDLTMGSSWAICLDIGKKYSGIVSGCMNTIGNLGGALAGYSTGKVLDHYANPVKAELPPTVASWLGNLTSGVASGVTLPGGVELGGPPLGQTADILARSLEATRHGWEINFLTYAGVYVLAMLLWFRIDSTRPVAQSRDE
jgi:MFS transporter, ACS family, glucarate transporter